MKFLKDSFAYLHKAVNSIDEKNILEKVQSPFGPNKITRLSLTIIALGHPFDHYGQMVEYLRMNNIVPPPAAASSGIREFICDTGREGFAPWLCIPVSPL